MKIQCNLARMEIRVLKQCDGSTSCKGTARSDGSDRAVRLNDVSSAAHNIHILNIGNQEQSFKVAQHPIRAPFFRKFYNTAREIATVLFELRFKAREKGERIGKSSPQNPR